MSADLHCHTKLSDGSLGIDDLIVLAKKQDIEVIAITDHNCQAGNVRGKLIGERHGVKVIPGVELSSFDSKRNREVHILCYLADSPDRLEGLCRRNTLACRKASQFMILKAAQKFPVTPELVVKCASGSTNIFIEHIMRALMEIGYTDSIKGELYDELFDIEAEGNILVQAQYEQPAEVIEAVHEAGGVAVLAHPGMYDSGFIQEMIEADIDGLEVWCPDNTEMQTETFLKLTKAHKILAVGGSNFHGMYNKKPISIGDFKTPEKQLDELLGYKSKKKRQNKKAASLAGAAK